MIHVTAAIGLAIAFLLEIMFWSVAPIAAAVVVTVILMTFAIMAIMKAIRQARPPS